MSKKIFILRKFVFGKIISSHDRLERFKNVANRRHCSIDTNFDTVFPKFKNASPFSLPSMTISRYNKGTQ